MATPLSPEELRRAAAELPGWECEAEGLTRTYRFATFRAALAYMVRAGFEAEELNHHPEWTNVYSRVVVRLRTHDAGDRVTAPGGPPAPEISPRRWRRPAVWRLELRNLIRGPSR